MQALSAESAPCWRSLTAGHRRRIRFAQYFPIAKPICLRSPTGINIYPQYPAEDNTIFSGGTVVRLPSPPIVVLPKKRPIHFAAESDPCPVHPRDDTLPASLLQPLHTGLLLLLSAAAALAGCGMVRCGKAKMARISASSATLLRHCRAPSYLPIGKKVWVAFIGISAVFHGQTKTALPKKHEEKKTLARLLNCPG